MHRFYAEEGSFAGDTALLSPEDARHALRVLRLSAGDAVELLADGRRFEAELLALQGEALAVRALRELPGTEARLRVTLYQGLPKADKMELICQKAVELGAACVVPVLMTRSVSRPDARDGARKAERWRKIAREAGKQSGRCRMMEVLDPLPFAEALSRMAAHDALIVPWEEARAQGIRAFAAAHPDLASLGIVIGPEGGIDPAEIEQLRQIGAAPLTLGPRILRTETAAMASIAAVMALLGEMEAVGENSSADVCCWIGMIDR